MASYCDDFLLLRLLDLGLVTYEIFRGMSTKQKSFVSEKEIHLSASIQMI